MKAIGIIRIVISFICVRIIILFLGPHMVWADTTLPVSVTMMRDMEPIMYSEDTTLYAASPVLFTLPQSKNGKYYYRMRTSVDKSGQYNELADNRFILNMSGKETDEDYYQVDFRYSEAADEDGENTEIYSAVYTVIFDLDYPDIEVVNKEVLNNRYNTDMILYLDITDSGSCIADICAQTAGEPVYRKTFSTEEGVKHTKAEILLSQRSSSSDGQELELRVTDAAGNSMASSYRYYIDDTIPQIRVLGQNRESGAVIENFGKSFADMNVSIEVYDRVPDDLHLKYSILKEVTGITVTDEVELAINDVFSCQNLTISEDGHYHISAYAIDGAGNISQVAEYDFSIDKSPPEIIISGIRDGVDERQPVQVKVQINEELYEECSVSINVLRRRQDEITTIPVKSFVMGGPSDSVMLNLINDGDYDIYVKAVDVMGRLSEEKATFRIDSHAPKISISGVSDGEITADAPVITIIARDIFYDATIVDLQLQSKGINGEYQELEDYKYVMKNKEDSHDIQIDNEGDFRLICNAIDRSGNSNSKTLDFSIDYTPPVIESVDKWNNVYLSSFTLISDLWKRVSDRNPVDVSVYVNDDPAKPDEKIVKEGRYTLWVLAQDAAQNYSEEKADFIIDNTGPQIVVKGMSCNGSVKRGKEIEITLADDMDFFDEVLCNGSKVALTNQGKKADIIVAEYGKYDIQIKAEDKAGNVTDKIIKASCDKTILIKTASENHKKEDRNSKQNIVKSDKNIYDLKRIVIGLITVLTGTFLLVFRGLGFVDTDGL